MVSSHVTSEQWHVTDGWDDVIGCEGCGPWWYDAHVIIKDEDVVVKQLSNVEVKKTRSSEQ